MKQIKEMCVDVGFEVIFSQYVMAGKWEEDRTHTEAKEILLVCKKVGENLERLI